MQTSCGTHVVVSDVSLFSRVRLACGMLVWATSPPVKAQKAEWVSPQQAGVPGPFAGCFPAAFGILAGNEGLFLTSPASGCRRAGAAHQPAAWSVLR